jgi:hypothetical protein
MTALARRDTELLLYQTEGERTRVAHFGTIGLARATKGAK